MSTSIPIVPVSQLKIVWVRDMPKSDPKGNPLNFLHGEAWYELVVHGGASKPSTGRNLATGNNFTFGPDTRVKVAR